jgi:PTH1 family peptidyl-tRNA hydrolase
MKVILGIGNPGRRYASTRHNTGFRVVDALAADLSVSVSRKQFESLVGDSRIGSERVLLVKPQTYVNESGRAASAVLSFYRLSPPDMLVVSDEAALPLGTLRFSRSGSSAGHKGLASIIQHIGEDFPRLRIGIGAPRRPPAAEEGAESDLPREEGGMISHVLGRPSKGAEDELAAHSEAEAAAGCAEWVREGIDACMNRHNGIDMSEPQGRARPARSGRAENHQEGSDR